MKRVLTVCLFAGAISMGLAGCDSSDRPSSAVEDASQSEIEQYEALIAAEEGLMTQEDLEGEPEEAAEGTEAPAASEAPTE